MNNMLTTTNRGGGGENPMDFFSKRNDGVPRVFQSFDCVANT